MDLRPPLDLSVWGNDPHRAIAFQILHLLGKMPHGAQPSTFDEMIARINPDRRLSPPDAAMRVLLEHLEGKLITSLLSEDILGPQGYELCREDLRHWLGEAAAAWLTPPAFAQCQERARRSAIIDEKLNRVRKIPTLGDLQLLLDEEYVVEVERANLHPRLGPTTTCEVVYFDPGLITEPGTVGIYHPESLQPRTLSFIPLDLYWELSGPVTALTGYRLR